MAPTFNGSSFIGTTSVTINWIPPPSGSQNGVITSYAFNITGNPFPYTDPPLNFTTDGSSPDVASKSLEITGLEEYNEYTISIAAVNIDGTGPFTTGNTFQTFPAGKSIYTNVLP